MVAITQTKIRITFEDLIFDLPAILQKLREGKEILLFKGDRALFRLAPVTPDESEWTEVYEDSLSYKPEFVAEVLNASEKAKRGEDLMSYNEVSAHFDHVLP